MGINYARSSNGGRRTTERALQMANFKPFRKFGNGLWLGLERPWATGLRK
ncbi:hypothetical protein ACVILL_005680 [Bradyrhizobium sp. USDA 3364]